MTDRDAFWSGRRVLVMGCTGFLGTWVARRLRDRSAHVVGLIRDPHRDSDFFRDKLHEQIRIIRGRADDVPRLRMLIHTHEIQIVFQLAADPRGVADEFTRSAVAAAGCIPVVVPVRHDLTVIPSTRSKQPGIVSLMRLPELFGGGDVSERWPAQLFLAAATGKTLHPPTEQWSLSPIGNVCDAVDGMLDLLATSENSVEEMTAGRLYDLGSQATGSDLYDCVRGACAGPRLHQPPAPSPQSATHCAHWRLLTEAVAETLAWYQSIATRLAVRGRVASAPKSAA